jgi:hypothetical protein
MQILDLDALDRAPVRHDPCDFFVVPQFVRADRLDTVNRDYPLIDGPGNFPTEDLSFGPVFGLLLEELRSDELKRRIAAKLGMDLDGNPLQITVRKYSEASDGNVHNDSQMKRVTALIYFNLTWPHEGGRLRPLRSPKNIDDYQAEVVPEGGTLLVLRRNETSFHGFKPCEAERRSLQMYYVSPKRDHRAEKKLTLKKRIKRWLKENRR